jgi:putative tricarboxylic transport membrane protein
MVESNPRAAGPEAGARGVVKSPKYLAAGCCLILVALFITWTGSALDSGTLRSIGPGFLPRVIAVLLAVIGLGLVIAAFAMRGDPIGRWPWRAPLFITLGIVAFAYTIRLVGLTVAGPLVVFIGGIASPEIRAKELAIVAVVLTVLCVALFRYALGLPIPILIVPGYLHI